jgi:hypothetical protein
MFTTMAKSFTALRNSGSEWQRASSALFLVALLFTGSGCFENGNDPVSPVPATGPGGDPQTLPSNRAIMTNPNPGSRLTPSTTFEWTPGSDVDRYTLDIYGSNDEQDPLASFTPGQNTSYTVQIMQIERRPVLWVKLTTYHLDGSASEPFWAQYWYPEEQEGWTLNHFEVRFYEWWGAGTGGERTIYENNNVVPSTRQFTPEPINHVWETGHYRIDSTLRIDQLPDNLMAGETGAVKATVSGNISSAGLGFSRSAAVGLSINGSANQAGEPNAENRPVSLQTSVGPNQFSDTERITFETSAGLQSINDSRLRIRVVAVYRRTS